MTVAAIPIQSGTSSEPAAGVEEAGAGAGVDAAGAGEGLEGAGPAGIFKLTVA